MTLSGRIIRHNRTMDVCFLVEESYDMGNETIIVRGHWINMGFKESYPIFSNPSEIEIKTEDFGNWEVLSKNDEYIRCFRDGDWKPLIASSVSP